MLRLLFVVVVCVMCLGGQSASAQVSEKLRSQIDAARKIYEDHTAEARKKLLNSLDEEIERLGKAKGMKADDQVEAMAIVEKERKTFEKLGRIPFSPKMRPTSITYMTKLRSAEKILLQVYENVAKQGATAAEKKAIVKEQDKVPKLIGKFECIINESNGLIRKWSWNLWSDGSVNRNADDNDVHPKSWSFGKKPDEILIINVTADSPKGGFKDLCRIHENGQKFDAKNQKGGTYIGVRID